MAGDIGAAVNAWVNIVRRARLGATTTLVALTVASYANKDGTSVFPGAARLAVQCEISYSTARASLAKLRRVGLIEMVRRGARKRGQADEYRLILAEDLMDRCEVPTPEQERQAIERLNRSNVDAGRRRSSAHQIALETETREDSEPVSSATDVALDDVLALSGDAFLALASDRAPTIGPLHVKEDPPFDVAGVPEAVTLRAREAAAEDQISPEEDAKPTTTPRPTPRWARGQDVIAEAMANRAAATAAHRERQRTGDPS